MHRWQGLDPEAIRESNRKQAVVPRGATVLDPVGTAPGLVVPPGWASRVRRSSFCRDRRASSTRCGRWRVDTDAFRAAIAGATIVSPRRSCVCTGCPSPRSRTRSAPPRRPACRSSPSRSRPACAGERSRSRPATSLAGEAAYLSFIDFIAQRHGEQLFSRDGSTVDAQVASLLSRADGGGGRVVHGRADVGAADRAARVLGVLRRRGRRVLERGQGVARRRRPGPDRTLRSGVERGGGSAGVRRGFAVRRGRRASGSPGSPVPAAAPRTSRSAPSASRCA